ncbi:hypothetical protein, partial [Thiolapillus sp.]|uniref:hypothetical protein n=1 Tax=Thiolapillus sp. TaxID=2017437 RepID=UPI003AF45B5B
PMNLPGSRAHYEAEDLMRRECADSIRARGNRQPQTKAGYTNKGRIYGSNISFVTNEFSLAIRGGPYMTPVITWKNAKAAAVQGVSGSMRRPMPIRRLQWKERDGW